MLQPGHQIAGYRIVGVLGRGGMGVVYEAEQLSLERTVALKLLSPELTGDVVFHERFRREGRIQAGLDHPNIVTVHEAGEADEGLFIAMRLIRGSTLKDLIAGRELDDARTLRLLRPMGDALDTAHEAKLIHRDIKPQNVLVARRDHPYLADFGLTTGSSQRGLTKTGEFVGTLDYIAPEQIVGDPPVPQSDIYAFAAMLYECLTGAVPFVKPSDVAVMYAHLGDPPPRVSDRRPDLPVALDDVIARSMSKEPSERHPSAGALLLDAERAIGTGAGRGGTTVPSRIPDLVADMPAASTVASTLPAGDASDAPATLPSSPEPPKQRHAGRIGAGLLGLVAVLGLAGAGFALGQPGRTHEKTAASNAMTISYRAPLTQTRPRSNPIEGLVISDPLTLTSPSMVLRAGRLRDAAPGVDPAPPALRERWARPVKPQPVQLGPNTGLRYDAALRGGGSQRMYAVPTSKGWLTVTCELNADAGTEAATSCDRVAATMRPTGARAVHPGPDRAYARGLAAVVTTLDRRVAARSGDLAAKRITRRAATAAGLAPAYSDAARRIRSLPVPPHDRALNTNLARASDRVGSALGDLATAAQRRNRPAYNRARSAVAVADAQLARAFTKLEAAGYAVK